MKALRYIILFITASVIANSSIASGELEIPGGKLTGALVDSANTKPLSYANVALYNSSDSTLITGVMTGDNGEFELNSIPDGNYYLIIQYIGYQTKVIKNIDVSRQDRKVELGKIQVEPTAILLEAANVVANKSYTEYKLDRKVINVSQDISNTGVSAAEVLEKSPSVRVDIEGNVTLRGSSNFKVFIDGKPSVLDGSEALQQIPANTIENIEVITNPSVKYDPDGTSGIININLKKNRLKGLSGVVDVTAATGDKYAADLYLNYKTGNFNIYGGIDWSDRKFYSDGREYRETYNADTTEFRKSISDQVWKRNGVNFKGGIDYYLGDKTILSLGGEYGTGGFGWERTRKIHDYTIPGTQDRYFIDDNEFEWDRYYYGLNASIIQKFNQKGHELRVFTFYSSRDGSQKQNKVEKDTDPFWNEIAQNPNLLRSIEEGPSSRFRIETDYSKPLWDNGKFEAGYHLRMNDDEESYYLDNYDYTINDWVRDDIYSKMTTFNRTINAVYGIFRHEFKGLEYQIGLRGEYTYREIKVLNTNDRSLVDRFDYFPSIHVSRRVNEMNQFMASYSRRIDRPRGYYLEPFVTYVDENTRRIGNPDLLPEYTDSYEIGYLRTLKAGNFNIETYYRNTKNNITRIQYYDAAEGFLINTFQNLNDDQAIGVESSFVYDVTKWFNVNLSGTYYYYQIEDLTGDTKDVRTSNNYDGRLITSFNLPTQTRFQLNAAYDSPTVTAQGESEGSYYMDFTAKQEFLDKSLSVTLKISDILASRNSESYRYGQGFYTYNYRERESRVVSLTLSYRLNNYKEKPVIGDMEGDEGGGM